MTVHHVYDISDKPVIPGAQRILAAEAIANDYDLVVVSQVLEHAPFPQDIIAEVAHAMGDDNYLWIEVPFESVIREAANPESAYRQKRHWHEHINFFTVGALGALLEGAGLAVTERSTFDVTIGGKTSTVMGALCRLR